MTLTDSEHQFIKEHSGTRNMLDDETGFVLAKQFYDNLKDIPLSQTIDNSSILNEDRTDLLPGKTNLVHFQVLHQQAWDLVKSKFTVIGELPVSIVLNGNMRKVYVNNISVTVHVFDHTKTNVPNLAPDEAPTRELTISISKGMRFDHIARRIGAGIGMAEKDKFTLTFPPPLTLEMNRVDSWETMTKTCPDQSTLNFVHLPSTYPGFEALTYAEVAHSNKTGQQPSTLTAITAANTASRQQDYGFTANIQKVDPKIIDEIGAKGHKSTNYAFDRNSYTGSAWSASNSSYSYNKYEPTYSGSSSYNPSWNYGSSSYSYKPLPPPAPGLVGLSNLGNTCYMNSALQCLLNTIPLTSYFLSGKYLFDLNTSNVLGLNGDIARDYAHFTKQIWDGDRSSISPTQLKDSIGRIAPRFLGYAQQDSGELVGELLTGLHEDLNRVKQKPYQEEPDDLPNDLTDDQKARIVWDSHKRRNDSVIIDLMHGQFKSTTTCPDCGYASNAYDPFAVLIVPIPVDQSISIHTIFVPAPNSSSHFTHSFSINLTLQKSMKLKEMATLVANLIHTSDDRPDHFDPLLPVVVTQFETVGDAFSSALCLDYAFSDLKSTVFVVYQVAHQTTILPASYKTLSYGSSHDDEPVNIILVSSIVNKSYSYSTTYFNQSVILAPKVITLNSTTDTSHTLATQIWQSLRTMIDAQRWQEWVAQRTAELERGELSGTETAQPLSVLENNAKVETPNNSEMTKDEEVPSPSFSFVDPRDKEPIHGKDNRFVIPSTHPFGPSVNYATPKTDLPWFLSREKTHLLTGLALPPEKEPTEADKKKLQFNDFARSSTDTVSAEIPLELPPRHLLPFRLSTPKSAYDTNPPELQVKDEWVKLDQVKYDSNMKKVTLVILEPGLFIAERVADCVPLSNHEEKTESQKKGHDQITLRDCIDALTLPEQLNEDNMWKCPICKERKQAQRKFEVFRLPPILVVQLKRFSSSAHASWAFEREKLTTFVDYPVNGLDLTDVEQCGDGWREDMHRWVKPYELDASAADSDDENREFFEDDLDNSIQSMKEEAEVLPQTTTDSFGAVYDLFGVSVHSGGTTGGHYWAYVKNVMKDAWYEMNDSSVSKMNRMKRDENGDEYPEDLVNKNGYILYYKRRGIKWDNDQITTATELRKVEHVDEKEKKEKEEHQVRHPPKTSASSQYTGYNAYSSSGNTTSYQRNQAWRQDQSKDTHFGLSSSAYSSSGLSRGSSSLGDPLNKTGTICDREHNLNDDDQDAYSELGGNADPLPIQSNRVDLNTDATSFDESLMEANSMNRLD